jgi:hypothetical protein
MDARTSSSRAAMTSVGGSAVRYSAMRAGESAPQGVFGHHRVAVRAEQQSDRRTFVGLPDLCIECLEIELELAEVFGFESIGLELDGHERREASVEEQEIEREVAIANLQRELRADEAELRAQFLDEALQVRKERRMEVALVVLGRKLQEVEQVGVPEQGGCLGVFLDERRAVHRPCRGRLEPPVGAEFAQEAAVRPLAVRCLADVELAFLDRLAPFQDEEVERPRQKSQQCRDFCVIGVRVTEALHPEQVRAGEAALAGKCALDGLGHADDHAVTVCANGNAPRDASAEFPVELDERAGDGTTRADTGRIDQ